MPSEAWLAVLVGIATWLVVRALLNRLKGWPPEKPKPQAKPYPGSLKTSRGSTLWVDPDIPDEIARGILAVLEASERFDAADQAIDSQRDDRFAQNAERN